MFIWGELVSQKRMFKRFGAAAFAVFSISIFMLMVVSSLNFAASDSKTAPDVLIKSVTEEVVAIIKEDAKAKSDEEAHKKAIELVQTHIASNFDFEAMTRMAIGPHWRKATQKQQQSLIEEFRALLLHTYTQVLFLYHDNSIVFMPLRAPAKDTDVTVRMKFRQSGRPEIIIDFAMEKMPEGWRVYEVTVDGISLITTYRNSFSDEIKKSGIDGLIKALNEKNNPPKK